MNKILIGIISFALWTGAVFLYGNSHGKKSIAVAVNNATIAATKKARKEEQNKQEKVNAFLKKQYNEILTINDVLNDDISKLHKRESRRNLSKADSSKCKGTSGRELSKPDAEFLTREAARGDRIRVGLKTCYDYADEIVKEGGD
jgi:hypothetical protein